MTKLVEREPIATFSVTFRDSDHFYRVVKALNEQAGHGKDNWTLDGRVRKHLRMGNPITRKVIVYNPSFDKEHALFLALI
jgi:hypothetical protein